MPKFPDHPLTVARERAGLSQQELANRAGVSRLTIAKIEGAATRTLNSDTASAIGQALMNLGPNNAALSLQLKIDAWFSHLRPQDHLSPAQQSLLRLSPEGLTARFDSFASWRQAIAPSVEFFAALIGVNRQTVVGYEKGIRVNGMSSNLASALLTLGMTQEYLTALRRLPPSAPRKQPAIGRYMLDTDDSTETEE